MQPLPRPDSGRNLPIIVLNVQLICPSTRAPIPDISLVLMRPPRLFGPGFADPSGYWVETRGSPNV
jgi:hypothetical protein